MTFACIFLSIVAWSIFMHWLGWRSGVNTVKEAVEKALNEEINKIKKKYDFTD